MSAVALALDASRPALTPALQHKQLRAACEELVGMGLFGQLLRQARQSSLNGQLFHSSAERTFTGQMDDLLVQRMSGRQGTPIGEAMYRKLSVVLPPLAKSPAGGHADLLAQ